MRTLIVEDDFGSQKLLEKFFQPLGTASLAAHGTEALEKFTSALNRNFPFDLICLSHRPSDRDEKGVLNKIRALEELVGIGGLQGVKVLITAAQGDFHALKPFFKPPLESILAKPLNPQDLVTELENLGLLPPGTPSSVFLS